MFNFVNTGKTFGLDYACSCCYDCPTYLEDRIGKVCIYTDPRVSKNSLYLRNHLCCLGWYDGTRQCPGMDRLCDVSMTSWCLNCSNLTVHGKCFVRGRIFGLDRTNMISRRIKPKLSVIHMV